MNQDVSLLKSSSGQTSPKGNVTKYLSYREAWTRIKQAQSQGFYLEAVTIVESIITDRLTSYLISIGEIQPTAVKIYPTFKKLIDIWKQHYTVDTQDCRDLQIAVDKWREQRNKVVHGMVKSHPGTATNSIVDFLLEAKLTAAEGERLARAVSKWVQARKVCPNHSSESENMT